MCTSMKWKIKGMAVKLLFQQCSKFFQHERNVKISLGSRMLGYPLESMASLVQNYQILEFESCFKMLSLREY